MSSMLNILCNNPIPELIDYVIRLPTAPKPKLGAVATLTAKSKQHAECLILLNNLTSASKAKGPLWECTNTLLKLSLIMYQELALIEVSLDDEEQIEKACCAVM